VSRLVIISTMAGFPWGGSEFLWAEVADRALRDGHSVAISLSDVSSTNPAVARLREQGAVIFPRRREPTLGARALGRLGRTLGRDKSIGRIGSNFRSVFATGPDQVLVSQGDVFDVLLHPGLQRHLMDGVPFVTLNQLCIEARRILGAAERDMLADLFARARFNAFVSDQNRILAERQLARSIPNTIVVQNPVNLSNRATVPWPSGDAVRLACVARLDVPHKGQDVLFEVLSTSPWRDRDWTCQLYGTGAHRDYLLALARHYGIAHRIVFAGQSDDIRQVWANNHLLLMPSRREGTPLALVEAMLCGRPAVVTDVGDNAAWVSDGDTGFVAEAPTAESFGKAMDRAWEAKSRWRAMGAAAREVVSTRLSQSPGEDFLRKYLHRDRPSFAATSHGVGVTSTISEHALP
jgi:glycosyltransferase involved in cell wall biosynthesis